MQTRAERVARGWLVGTFATGAAAVSHTLAGGYRPDALGLVVGVVFAGMLGTLAIGRRPSLPRLTIAVAGAQLAFHLLFSLLGADPHTASAASMPGMRMDETVAAPAALSPIHNHLLDPGMWIAHLIAGILTVWFLRRAETAVWGMLRRLVVRLLAPVAGPAAVARSATALVSRARELPPGRHVTALPQRGPPLLASH